MPKDKVKKLTDEEALEYGASREGSPTITETMTGEQVYSIPSSTETYQAAEPALEKETKEYIQSRGFVHGGSVCKGGGKAIRGLGFKGVK